MTSEVTEHVRSIVTAAEDVAKAVKREAEQRADARLEEADIEAVRRLTEADRIVAKRRRRVAELSDAIVARAESVLGELEEAAAARHALGRIVELLAESGERLDSESAPAGDARGAPASEIDGVASFDGPRQVALKMAVAGSNRREVAAHLQLTFGLQEPGAILNDVFGESDVRR